ncbi:MAG: hypothetical protein ACFFDN_00250 [Candidatus Hodarchaeota archaeon]
MVIMITGSIIALQRRDPVSAVKFILTMLYCLFIIMGSFFLIIYEDVIVGFFSIFNL